jgi:hypothetical protein
MKPVQLAIVSVFVIGMALAGWYLFSQPAEEVKVAHVAVVFDRSNSLREDIEGKSASGVLTRAFSVPGLGKESSVIVTGTGDGVSNGEPVSIATVSVPLSSRIIEGKDAVVHQRKQLLDDTVARYIKEATETRMSPIFLAVKRALAQLKAAGCVAGSGCTLFIRSDGEETEETYLKESIKRRKLLKKGAPAPLDNSGIAITWCGTAESRGSVSGRGKRRASRSSASADFVKELWSTLFTSPELIVFEPLCLARDAQGPRLYYGEEA